jgi:hypothetical protein
MRITGTNDVPGSGDNTDNPTPETPKPKPTKIINS